MYAERHIHNLNTKVMHTKLGMLACGQCAPGLNKEVFMAKCRG